MIHRVHLRHQATQREIVADLHDDLPVEELTAIEKTWQPHRIRMSQSLETAQIPFENWPESLHWNWELKGTMLQRTLRPAEFRVFALKCDSRWQGVMITLLARKLPFRLHKARPPIYVDYLEAAPWNWDVTYIAASREFAGIGAVLMRAAITQSLAEGRRGRMALHALPRATKFYEKVGFEFIAFDKSYDDLAYYELSSRKAEIYLRGT